MASSRMVAFQHDHKLYLASVRDAERPVASREMPLGWTPGGLYTYAYKGRRLLLRSDTGALVKTIARQPLGSDYAVAHGTLYFIARGVLRGAHGASVWRLASLASLRVSTGPWLQPVGRLLELQDNSRLIVLRPDGSVFASSPLPRAERQTESISSSLISASDQSAVAFTAAAGESNDPTAAHPGYGSETVYLLRPGASRATPIHSERVAFRVCERGANLQWHSSWLLYSNPEGSLAAIDTTGARRTVELGKIVKRLRGARHGFTASWSGQRAGP